MARLKRDTWETIRAERETGVSFRELAEKYGVSHQAIQKRAKLENWGNGEDIAATIRRKVAAKVASVVATDSLKKKVAAIDNAVDRVAEIVIGHQTEWDDHREVFPVKSIASDFELGKSAKISAEVITIRQKGERIAYGLDDGQDKPGSNINIIGFRVEVA